MKSGEGGKHYLGYQDVADAGYRHSTLPLLAVPLDRLTLAGRR